MRVLLDTHALLWGLNDDPRLESKARNLISDPLNDILVSIVSLWEIVLKTRIGKLDAGIQDIVAEIDVLGFEMLDIRPEHLKALQDLPMHHRDPFDHLLIAQAIAEGVTFLSADRRTSAYPVTHVHCRNNYQ